MKVKFWILFILGMLSMAASAQATIITVNSKEDNQISGDGKCTLREAIQNSAQNADTTGGDCAVGEFNGFGFNPVPITKDKIHFNIPPDPANPNAPITIKLTSMLGLAFLEQVDILGDTQPGSNCGTKAANYSDRVLKIKISGELLPAATIIGIKLMNATIARPDAYVFRGFSVINFPQAAVYVGSSKRSEISCNNIGIDTDNVTVKPNKTGLTLFGIPLGGMMPKYGENVVVKGNMITGNTKDGIRVENVGKSYIHENLIGVNAANQVLGNGDSAIDFSINDLPGMPPTGTNGLWSIQDNVIAGGMHGILVRSGRFLDIEKNLIFDTAKLGIDLIPRFPLPGQPGINPNDAGDWDSWGVVMNSNQGLNTPVLTSAVLNGAGTTLTVGFNLDVPWNNPPHGFTNKYIIQFFGNPAALLPGQRFGKIYLGETVVVVNNTAGAQPFTAVLNLPVGVGGFNNVTATTTETELVYAPPQYGIPPFLKMAEPPFPEAPFLPNPVTGSNVKKGSTSEFSAPFAVAGGPPPPPPPGGGGNPPPPEPPPLPWNPVPPPSEDPKIGVVPVDPASLK